MLLRSKIFVVCGVMGRLCFSQVGAIEEASVPSPQEEKSAEKEKAIHDYWAMKQATDQQFPDTFPKELRDKIAQTEMEIMNFHCPTFETAEDLSDFGNALSNLSQFNEVKVFITLNGKRYIFDKTEKIIQLTENNNTNQRKYSTYDLYIKKAKFIGSKEMKSPRRVQCFYDIDAINQNRFNKMGFENILFKNVKMTILY